VEVAGDFMASVLGGKAGWNLLDKTDQSQFDQMV
jgi:hypothetical protein